MHVEKVTFSPEKYPTLSHYPFNLNAFRRIGEIRFSSSVTFFMGENGTGKSTLLEALARKSGIHIWERPEWTRYEKNPYEETLYRFIALQWRDGVVPGAFFGAEIFRDFSQYLDEWAVADPGILKYFGGRSLITQSHGQSLMSYFRARYRIKGLYLLDEPETALSPKSQLELLRLIRDMGRMGHAQFIIATHSPILLACPGAEILSFNRVPIERIDYENTEYYRIYKDFMENRERFLRQ